MLDPARNWAMRNLTGSALVGVLIAINNIPNNRVPRIQLDSQSSWATVDAVPGPKLAVWLETGAVYEVGDDGAVGDNPIA